MSNSCNFIGRCRDRLTGKLTLRLSQLHKDLLSIGKNNKLFHRKKANDAFFLSLSNKFLSLYDSELIFDSEAADAEPTLASFYEIAKEVMPEVTFGDIRDILAKKFGEGVYSYDEALLKMTSFNKEMLGAHTFMGTLRRQEDGKYKFEITYNAIDELTALMQTIADKNFIDIVTKKLNNLGIAIEMDTDSYYSTESYNRLSNGLLGLVRLKEGLLVTKDLAKETGHVIVGTLGANHPLVLRLTAIADNNPEVLAEIIGDAEWENLRDLPKEKRSRELIGHVIGKYLEDTKNIEGKGIKAGIKSIVKRMIDYIKTKFAFTDRDYKLAQYDAKYLSYKAARDFLGSNFVGNLDNALNTLETLEANSKKLHTKLASVIRVLDTLADRAKDWGFNTAKSYRETTDEAVTKFNEIKRQIIESLKYGGAIDDLKLQEATIEELMVATRFIINQIKEAHMQLVIAMADVDPLSGEPILDNEICKIIRKNEVLYEEATRLSLSWDGIMGATSLELDVKDLLRELGTVLKEALAGGLQQSANSSTIEENGYSDLIIQARRKLATRLLTKINGNLFLVIEQHVSFTGKRIERHHSSIIDLLLEILATSINPPLDTFSRFINAMTDSPSIINQLMALAIELKKHEANVRTLNAKDKLFQLYHELRAAGIGSTQMFMEVDDEGDYTGNIISERNWGQWEKKRKEDYIKWRDKWWEANKDLFSNVNEAYHDVIFLEAKGAFLKGWHDKNSVKIPLETPTGDPRYDEEGKPIECWAPAISTDDEILGKTLYDGEQYNKLVNSTESKDLYALIWLDKYMLLKRELDAMLPPGATNGFGVRAPQFQGTLTDKLHGAFGTKFSSKHIKRIGGVAVGHYIINKLAENPNDTEYGGEHDSYNEEDMVFGTEDIFSPGHINAINSYRRVPVYGVRKLKEQHTISTDLIHSTLAYAAMANNYRCLDDIIDEVEVLQSQLRSQIVVNQGKTIELLLKDHLPVPGYYNRMEDYMHQQVYNVYAPEHYKNLARYFRKAIGALTRFGSLWYLQFNVHSATTNTLTALWEILKESIGGEYFNTWEFIRAWGIFIKWSVKAVGNNIANLFTGLVISDHKGSDNESVDKMNLFLKMFDVLNENQRKFRDYHMETPGYQFFHGYSYANLVMLPYSITDKWMLTMAFIATAFHDKLVAMDGDKIIEERSIWDAYIIKDGELVLDTPRDKDKNAVSNAQWMVVDKNQKALNDQLEEKIKNDTVEADLQRAVYEYDRDGSLIEVNGNKVVKSIYVPWDTRTLALYKTKCRGINNKMHGIYNTNDGGAFLGKWILGPSIASLKKYAIGLIDRRFSRGRYDARSNQWRQGSTVTVWGNLFIDYVFSNDEHSIVLAKDTDRYKIAKRGANALVGLLAFTGIMLSGGVGAANILRRRGYSESQIANIRRYWADQMVPEILRCLLYMVAPPDELDDNQGSFIIKGLKALNILKLRENSSWDDDPLFPWLSEAMLEGYVSALNFSKKLPLHLSEVTDDDEYILTEDYFLYQALKYEHTIPFSIKGIIYYQLYRTILELDAYNLGSPIALYSLYSEYKNLTNSSIMGFSSLYDSSTLLGKLLERKTLEDLDEIAEATGKYNIYDKYSQDGQEIYTLGINDGFKKGAMHAIKVGPLRTPATWLYGYTAKKNLAFWRSRALGLDEADDKVFWSNFLPGR